MSDESVCPRCQERKHFGACSSFTSTRGSAPIDLIHEVTAEQPNIQLLTIDHVPGSEIEHAYGAVLGHGDAWFGTTRERVAKSRKEAIDDLRSKALRLGADAVIGLTVTVTGVRGFWGISALGQSAVVQASGTAVKIKR